MKRALARIARIALAAPFALLACSELFDEPSQCQTDADCARFNAVCDVPRAVCVTSTGGSTLEGGTSGGPDTPDPNGDAATNDTSTTTKNCGAATKPTGVVGTKVDGGVSEITGTVTLDCEKDWTLEGQVFVRSTATLIIESGTTIRAKKGTNAALVVSPGGRIMAKGERDLPIVITSDAPAPAAGDWRGLFLLGVAPPAAQLPFEDDPTLAYGGVNPDDDSGLLNFVRIEYARNGLVLAGVGRKTKIDFVQVRKTVDNCFFFYGGTADAKHLVCQYPGDEQFEAYLGYAGRLQFIFGQKTTTTANQFNRHGLLIDDAKPVIYNATIAGDTVANNNYGLVFRDGASMDIANVILTGWFAGIDATGDVSAPNELRGSLAFGNLTNPAYAEDPNEGNENAPTFNDDNGFGELDWFNAPARANALTDPTLLDLHNPKNPKPWPKTPFTTKARTPPPDGFFDTTAIYIGAFKDDQDQWTKGWTRFDDK